MIRMVDRNDTLLLALGWRKETYPALPKGMRGLAKSRPKERWLDQYGKVSRAFKPYDNLQDAVDCAKAAGLEFSVTTYIMPDGRRTGYAAVSKQWLNPDEKSFEEWSDEEAEALSEAIMKAVNNA